MRNYKKLVLLACAFLIRFIAMSQTTAAGAATTDTGLMRSEGKIYVVMAVVVTILAGILVYIIRLDRKISRLEKGENL